MFICSDELTATFGVGKKGVMRRWLSVLRDGSIRKRACDGWTTVGYDRWQGVQSGAECMVAVEC